MTDGCLAWHQGCEADVIRNNFIIPLTVKIIKENKLQSILDVGASTGYISQKIQNHFNGELSLTLVDISSDKIKFAKKIPELSNAYFYNENYFSKNNSIVKLYDFIIISNVFLEMNIEEIDINIIKSNLSSGGFVLVSHPDTLLDLFQSALEIGEGTLSDYTRSCVRLEKLDKFTGQPYPFVAHRISTLIELFVSAGLSLCGLHRAPGEMGHMCLVFER